MKTSLQRKGPQIGVYVARKQHFSKSKRRMLIIPPLPEGLGRLAGVFLLRFADRQFAAVLFHLPSRFTRFEPSGRSPVGCSGTIRRGLPAHSGSAVPLPRLL
jgi:hypothetical protein